MRGRVLFVFVLFAVLLGVPLLISMAFEFTLAIGLLTGNPTTLELVRGMRQ